ncbi:unnamed protein product [Cuscuta campestris]|uniref:Uncharacterized protein n=1 Tax=Cuscuta campestris TaxID=132261 RepID=A0A484MN03_9ASTE|nr:unnamed protein product [Cuscuta campestris]
MLSCLVDQDDENDDVLDVETGTGSIFPTMFHETTKCPDAFIRNPVRLKVALNCPGWDGNRLLETYDTRSDKFCITPCAWDKSFVEYCEAYQKKSDREICNTLYTVPVNENPSIAEFGRRLLTQMLLELLSTTCCYTFLEIFYKDLIATLFHIRSVHDF